MRRSARTRPPSGARRAGWCGSTTISLQLRPRGCPQAHPRRALVDGKVFALPFYGESSFTFYRKDFSRRRRDHAEKPTYADVEKFAKATPMVQGHLGHLPGGKPGWGENMATWTRCETRLADAGSMRSGAELTSPEWKKPLRSTEHDKKVRPSRRELQRSQREPRPLRHRQVRHVDRRDGGRSYLANPRSPR